MANQFWSETALTLATLGLLFGYHLVLWWHTRRNPYSTSIGHNQLARRTWIETIIAEKQDLLAVHTLRNWTTAASFLASTAVLISLGVLSAVYSTDQFSEAAQVFNILGQRDVATWTAKLFALLVLFISAFFNFSLAIRSFNHVAFLVTVARAPDSGLAGSAAADELARGAIYYTLGMRSYYLSIPTAFWLFGPLWMLGSAVVVTLGLWKMDFRQPKKRNGAEGAAKAP